MLQSPRKNGGTMNTREGPKEPTGRSNAGEGGGMATLVSVVTAGKRLAMAVKSPKGRQPNRSFRFNDNGSMVDLQCRDHASTFQCRGRTLPLVRELVIPKYWKEEGKLRRTSWTNCPLSAYGNNRSSELMWPHQVDYLQCENHASTFQCRGGTLPVVPKLVIPECGRSAVQGLCQYVPVSKRNSSSGS